jgi:hypothetical protein
MKNTNVTGSEIVQLSQADSQAENPVLERTRQAIYAQHPEMANAKKVKGLRL